MNKELFKLGFIGVSLYLIATGMAYAGFSTFFPPQVTQTPVLKDQVAEKKTGKFKLDAAIPRTESCPINGQMFTKQEMEAWSKTRPIYAMIENSPDARPQSGLSYADVVYEAIAEGGITRFGAVFYCGSALALPRIAPVRSIRIYFLNLAAEYGDRPILLHAGGANDFSGEGKTAPKVRALETIQSMGWGGTTGVDFDGTNNMGMPIFSRNENRLGRDVDTEHTLEGRLDKTIEVATKRGWSNVSPKGDKWDKTFVSWKFQDDVEASARPASQKISYTFSQNFQDEYAVAWDYDSASNLYKRNLAGAPHTDLLTEEQLTAKNVIVQFVKEEVSIDENLHMYYEVIGSGTGLLFQNGQAIKINWKKPARNSRTIFTDSKTGKEISLVRGQVWVSILGIGSEVTY